jgi:hypothetical protein
MGGDISIKPNIESESTLCWLILRVDQCVYYETCYRGEIRVGLLALEEGGAHLTLR